MLNILRKMKRFLNVSYRNRLLKEQLRYDMRNDWLIDKALNSDEPGISHEKLCECEVIVSLTTYGKRLYDVASTIESIMQGSMKPNRFVLWLGDDMKGIDLPIALQNQCKRGLDIRYCEDLRSYTKLVPSLMEFPEAGIITIDDDAIYCYDLVEKLVRFHNMYPKDIISNRTHQMVLDKNGRPVSYMKWNWCVNPSPEDSHLLFLTGVGGTFYPPNSLHPEVTNDAVFMDICKFADDVWFNAMALMAGTRIRKCYTHDKFGKDYYVNANVQDTALAKINTGKECANDKQLQAVFERYGLWKKLLDK